jgi:hypothetical protein
MTDVAIVIPVYKPHLEDFERISLEQCVKVLGNYSIRLITFKELDLNEYENILNQSGANYKVEYFNRSFFKDVIGYNKLLVSLPFYKKFIQFEYILIHQLDVFVFRDELLYWCEQNYSYCGAPWLSDRNGKKVFKGVGNGGFSLRKVRDHIRALKSFGYRESPKSLFRKYFLNKKSIAEYPKLIMQFLRELTLTNNTFYLFNDFSYNEDVFWSNIVGVKYNWYTKPNFDTATKFCFEMEGEFLLAKNNGELPFACHGWNKYDPDFWAAIIEKKGYKLTTNQRND